MIAVSANSESFRICGRVFFERRISYIYCCGYIVFFKTRGILIEEGANSGNAEFARIIPSEEYSIGRLFEHGKLLAICKSAGR